MRIASGRSVELRANRDAQPRDDAAAPGLDEEAFRMWGHLEPALAPAPR